MSRFNPNEPSLVILRPLDDGRWKVEFPDTLTAVVVDTQGVALACVPTGWPYMIAGTNEQPPPNH